MRSERFQRGSKTAGAAVRTTGLLLLVSLAMSCPQAQARLGEDFAKYKARTAKGLTPAGEKKSGDTTNYMFQLAPDQRQQMASPGYAAGVTITAVKGKITGQSMAIHPGDNPMVGGTMAAIHSFAFAYEAIGKPLPTEKPKAEAQFKAFADAVGQAFFGNAQNLRYPGFSALITISRDGLGNLVVAARPQPSAAAAKKPTG